MRLIFGKLILMDLSIIIIHFWRLHSLWVEYTHKIVQSTRTTRQAHLASMTPMAGIYSIAYHKAQTLTSSPSQSQHTRLIKRNCIVSKLIYDAAVRIIININAVLYSSGTIERKKKCLNIKRYMYIKTFS